MNPSTSKEFQLAEDPARQLIRRLCTNPRQEITQADWETLSGFTDGDEWRKLIASRPEAAMHCPWQEFQPYDWWPFFKYLPENFEKCPCPQEVPPRAWAYLLCRRPELAGQFDRWGKLSAKEWCSLLTFQPALACHCPCVQEAKALTPSEFDDGFLTFPTGDETTDFLADTDYLNYFIDYGDVLFAQLEKELETLNEATGE